MLAIIHRIRSRLLFRLAIAKRKRLAQDMRLAEKCFDLARQDIERIVRRARYFDHKCKKQ